MKNKEKNQIVIYETEDGQTQIDVRLEGETVWLTRQQLADLFNRNYKTISKHINNALKEELDLTNTPASMSIWTFGPPPADLVSQGSRIPSITAII